MRVVDITLIVVVDLIVIVEIVFLAHDREESVESARRRFLIIWSYVSPPTTLLSA